MEKRLVVNLLHKELSYQLHGAAIEVRKDFGPGHKEKLYQEAFAEELKRKKILFEKEKAIKIYSPKDGKYIGLFRPDFIIDKKIIVETKAEKFVSRDEIKRIYDYLRNSEYELAYFINFASQRLFVRRIIYTNDRKPFRNNPLINTNTKPKNTKNSLVSLSLILVLFSGLPAEAAILYFDSSYQDFYVGDEFEAVLMLNTENQNINAVEGKIILSENLIVEKIIDGDSIINLWVQKPTINSQNEINFSGIVPGGFVGQLNSQVKGLLPGVIFRMILKVKSAGEVKIDTTNTRVLLNDGRGTETTLSILTLSAITKSGLRVGPGTAIRQDKTPPELFTPEISRSPDTFNNQWFLVFMTQDKGYGIDHYEVSEASPIIYNIPWLGKLIISGSFKVAESPYLLKDQGLKSYIYVKAVDKAGNERIATLTPQQPFKWYEYLLFFIIIILGIIFAGIFIKRNLWKKLLPKTIH